MDLIFLLFDKLLVDPMANVLVGLARLFGGNFGIAIIVFTIVMRLITWPLTSSQYKQSRAMQSLQPKMQELQKKYKGKDPKKLQAETMSLYREHGVNPLGCLVPMLVQFPIWIALYQVISRTLGETPESLVGLSQQLYPVDFLRTAVPLNNHLLYWNLGQPDTSFVLLQKWRQFADKNALTVPFWVRGGIGANTAAACLAGGARGVVLDSQVLLSRETPLRDGARKRIAGLDGSETLVLGARLGEGYRIYARPDCAGAQELARSTKSGRRVPPVVACASTSSPTEKRMLSAGKPPSGNSPERLASWIRATGSASARM